MYLVRFHMQSLFLVDGSSYFYRAYFGLRGLATAAGFPTNAVFVFANMLTRITRQHADLLAHLQLRANLL